MAQMKDTTSFTESESIGSAAKCQSGPAASIVGKAMAAVETTRSFLGRVSELVLEKAASAKVATIGKGKTASAFVVGSLNDVKVRGLTALGQVKKAANDQITFVNGQAVAVLDEAKARVSKVGSAIHQSALGYVPVEVKARAVLVHGYANERFLALKGATASLSESTRERAMAQATSVQIMTMNTFESAKAQAAHLGDVVVETTPIPVKACVTTVYTSAATKVSAAQLAIVSVSDRAVDFSKAKASQVNTAVREVASDPKAQSATIGAAGGAATMGATGGAVGLASGSMAGAMVGLVPAIFTFGLSIPIGAVLGGGAGLCFGSAVGGTTGLVVGGAAGYKKDGISSGTKNVLAQVGDRAQSAKEKASASLQFVQSSVQARGRAMIGGSGTGGTESTESD